MKKLMIGFVALATLFSVQSCNSEEKKDTDVVDSGIYQGIAEEVDPDEKEIYVRTNDDNKLLELYFTESTELTRGRKPASFDELHENGRVQVEVERKGNRLEPISVKILD